MNARPRALCLGGRSTDEILRLRRTIGVKHYGCLDVHLTDSIMSFAAFRFSIAYVAASIAVSVASGARGRMCRPCSGPDCV